MKNNDFTSDAILPKLIRFMLPVLFAMFLQATYGAVDLLVVGKFCTNADVSGVSTGSQIIMTLTNLLVSFSMGITVAVGQKIGEKRPDEAAGMIGTGLCVFAILGALFTVIGVLGARPLAALMQAPKEAFDVTVGYIRICSFWSSSRTICSAASSADSAIRERRSSRSASPACATYSAICCSSPF